jgi:preprotein translocase subunit SecB
LCKARFVFREPVLLEEIPDYFYLNSIAILFPYVRAFVSIITLQANINPLMLPTMNLASLQETLKKNTNVCDDEKGKTIPNS